MRIIPAIFVVLFFFGCSKVKECHVSVNEGDTNPGTKNKPFKTFMAAEHIAESAEVITVHVGIYREKEADNFKK